MIDSTKSFKWQVSKVLVLCIGGHGIAFLCLLILGVRGSCVSPFSFKNGISGDGRKDSGKSRKEHEPRKVQRP